MFTLMIGVDESHHELPWYGENLGKDVARIQEAFATSKAHNWPVELVYEIQLP